MNLKVHTEKVSLKVYGLRVSTVYIQGVPKNIYLRVSLKHIVQSAGAVEYIDCFSAEGKLPNECPDYDTKQSGGDIPEVVELWELQNTPSLPSLPGSLGVVAPDMILTMSQIELNCILMLN